MFSFFFLAVEFNKSATFMLWALFVGWQWNADFSANRPFCRTNNQPYRIYDITVNNCQLFPARKIADVIHIGRQKIFLHYSFMNGLCHSSSRAQPPWFSFAPILFEKGYTKRWKFHQIQKAILNQSSCMLTSFKTFPFST